MPITADFSGLKGIVSKDFFEIHNLCGMVVESGTPLLDCNGLDPFA